MDDNLFILLFYIGIGLIISGIVLWTNWLSLNEHAHLIVLLYVAFFIIVAWGLFVATFVVVSISDFLGNKLGNKWPFRQINFWWDRQFEQ